MLTVEEIHAIERRFIQAAVRLQKAGVDGVQLHAAHSYLLSRFIDPTFNQRTDEYGGDVAGRFRMTERIIRGIHEACGPSFPVLIKINIDTKQEDHAAYREDMIWILSRCRELGVSLVELSGVDFINQPKTATLYYLDEAKLLRQAVPQMPLSLVGGVRSLADMEAVLDAGLDAVSLGRSLIAEPDSCQRLWREKPLSAFPATAVLSCPKCIRAFAAYGNGKPGGPRPRSKSCQFFENYFFMFTS